MNKLKPTTFYLVRHGQTDWNKERKIQGQLDIPLNETGEQQAKDLAKALKKIKMDLAFSSDLLRAKRTAEIIALEHKLAIQTTKLLRERNFGNLQGGPSSAFITHTKLMQKLIHEKRLQYKIDTNIESDEEVITRVITFLRETALAYPDKNILVGTHGGILRTILIHLGELTYEQADKIHISNGAYVKLDTDGVDFFVKEIIGLIEKEDVPSGL